MWARHSEITKLNHSVGRKKQLLEIKLSRLPLGRQRKTKCERASGSDVTVSKVGSSRWSRLFRLTIGVPGRQKPTFRDSWGVPNLDFCSLSLGLPYGGPLNTQGKLPKRNSFKKSPKLTGFTLTLPPQEYVKTVHSHTSRDQPKSLQETKTSRDSWKRLVLTKAAGKNTLYLLGYLQVVQYAAGLSLHELSYRGGLWWCICLWFMSALTSNSSPIFL